MKTVRYLTQICLLGVVLLVGLPAAAQAGAVLASLQSFQVFSNGAFPYAGLVQGSDGNFYGTTYQGGTNDLGTVFKISTNGALTSLYSFTGGDDGGEPRGSLVSGSDGSFYGTTTMGGTNDLGTVFKISSNGVLTSLYSFTGGIDGEDPWAGLVQGRDGNFYGTTSGGANGYGTVFKINPNGQLTPLYAFGTVSDQYGDPIDGAYPFAGLVQSSDGNFYGTTSSGGTNYYGTAYGTVFKISANGALTSLYSFTGNYNSDGDGANPWAGLVQGSDGYLYGTTYGGGTQNGWGTVFKISTNGALTTLYSFSGQNDGASPQGGLVQGTNGYFYGTTFTGGPNDYGDGNGTVFKISSTGALTTLYSFTGSTNGANPYAGLVQGNDGNFYGTTSGNFDAGIPGPNGGTSGNGTVFKLSSSGLVTTLYSFAGNDGSYPRAGLAQGSDGDFYGTTWGGGTYNWGTVFKISTNGVLATLYSFTGGDDGASPQAGLVEGSDGNLYGTTEVGGTSGMGNYGSGTVFKISTNGALTSLYSFTGGSDGEDPWAGLVQGADGDFYGTTYDGGTNSYGAVFKINIGGVLTRLYSFTGTNDGANPRAGLVQDSDGNLYGTTKYGGTNGSVSGGYGTVFKVSTNGALTSLHSFSGGIDGEYPIGGLAQGNDGNFYGTTSQGGTNNAGTLFRISTNGAYSTVYAFEGGSDGASPEAGLVQGRDGNFYGTAAGGGSGNGTVFKISTNGALATLYSFTGADDGASPQAGLVEGSYGNFYGTTSEGGQCSAGAVFRLTITQAAPVFQTLKLTNSKVSMTWSTEAGGTYQLQYDASLGSSNWINLGSPVTAIGATLSATDSVTNGPRRFYRELLLP